MTGIDADILACIPQQDIDNVTFYKRDEITTDLICCDVALGDKVWTFHEEMDGWHLLMAHLQALPGFRDDWFGSVAQSPFATAETVAFSRR